MEVLQVPLPHSKKGPYKGNFWPIFVKDMERLAKDPGASLVEETILKYINRSSDNVKVGGSDGTKYSLQELPNLKIMLEKQFSPELFAFVAQCALRLPDLFPSGTIPCLERKKPGRVELSRLQVGCLLTHMFFCTILPNKDVEKTHCGHVTGARAPTGPLTFINWLARDGDGIGGWVSQCGPTYIYLSTLLIYFRDLMGMAESRLKEKVVYERLVSDTKDRGWDPQGSSVSILEVEVHLGGRIGDIEQVEMDFANKHVGFGTTGTQEELLLGTSPESCVIVLFNEVLEANEAVLMTGARRYGEYSGYGSTAAFSGPCSAAWDWSRRRILALDAIAGPRNQLGDVTMMRELAKAWTGLAAVRGSSVSTGHWGCGAFGGDPYIKCLVQVCHSVLNIFSVNKFLHR